MDYLQKAVMPARERGWLAFGEETVCGYVVQTEQVAWAKTPEQLFRVHGLGFPGSPLTPDAPFLDVVRIPVTPFVRVVAAVGGNSEADAAVMHGDFIDHPPFSGTGFVAEVAEAIVPLWWLDPIRVPAGTELWRVFADGHEELVAIYGNLASGWTTAGEYSVQRAAWLAPSDVLGIFGTWRGQRVMADPLANDTTVVVSATESSNLHLIERGVWAATVPSAEVENLAAIRFTGTWRGLAFQVTQRFHQDGELLARLVYIGHDALRAEAAGLQKSDAGVYEATIPWTEFSDVQGYEITAGQAGS